MRSMKKSNVHKAKLNITTTLFSQLVATICGILIPRVMIGTFGSAMYGLTTSIAQFLSYISLLEGGIGRVARAELYVPLANRDHYEISRVYHATIHFFRTVGIVFAAYTLVMAFAYYDIADVQIADRKFIFALVWVISIGTLAKYLGGLPNLTLINADQKQYIGNSIIAFTTLLNAVLVVVLANLGCNIQMVKLGSAAAYVLQPLLYTLYVRKHYTLPKVGKDLSELKQKWTGIGQHIAYFLHTNTDVVLLTLFADIRLVAVYTVHSLVISSIRKIAFSFTSGMEAAFGEMIARKETEALQSAYRKYKFMLSVVSIILFGTTAVLIVPFVRLYTAGITDAEYIQPAFAMVLLFAEAIDCVMHPCCSLPVSANKLKQTRWGSYGEAAINIILSLILIWKNPLLGIAIGTLAATVCKSLYYLNYSAKHILQMKRRELLKNFLFMVLSIGGFALLGMALLPAATITNYFIWAVWGVVVVAIISAVTLLLGKLLYPEELRFLLGTFLRKHKK